MDVACCDRLDAEVLGEIAKKAEAARIPSLVRALELDVEAIATECSGEVRCGIGIEQREPAARAARQADEPLVQLGDGLERGRRR